VKDGKDATADGALLTRVEGDVTVNDDTLVQRSDSNARDGIFIIIVVIAFVYFRRWIMIGYLFTIY
jgi:hypothetical protein